MSETSTKLKTLQSEQSDFEWYPAAPEIMEAVKKDIWAYLRMHKNDDEADWRGAKNRLKIDEEWDHQKKKESLWIDTFLDIGAGDGRVLDFFGARKKYGIEIAGGRADDLIPKGVFLVGRNYWDVSLFEQEYSLIYSNPPFSIFEKWVNKILTECNFRLLYLVMPVRWKNQPEITKELERCEAVVIGEYDFSKAPAADWEARGKVNLVRVNAKWEKDKLEKHCVQEAGFFDVQAFGKPAESARNPAREGRGVRVIGRLKQDSLISFDGKTVSRIIIEAEHIEYRPEFADRSPAAEEAQQEEA